MSLPTFAYHQASLVGPAPASRLQGVNLGSDPLPETECLALTLNPIPS